MSAQQHVEFFRERLRADMISECKSKSETFIKEQIKKGDNCPTDAYGEIEFGRNARHPAKYVKVGNKTDPAIIYQLLTEHWKLKAPNLIISVTGGAKNFKLPRALKNAFRKSLIKASESTGAWITSGGTHTGVMKHVGLAVKDYAAIKSGEERVVTIGIASWGVIHGREKLLNETGQTQNIPKVYDAEGCDQKGNANLDHNHSHFILVDDSSENKYGREIDLRTKFESYLSNQKTHDKVNVMIICILVQGGPGSLRTVAGSIENGTPVVIVGGSGGWADVLASVYIRPVKSVSKEIVEQLMRDNDIKLESEKLEEWTKMVNKCIDKKNLMSVFELDPTNTNKNLDIAILKALLNAPATDQTSKRAHEKLRLAMAWNRSDIIRSQILKDDTFVGKKEIANVFFDALRDNKQKFCKVFLDYDVDLKKYCTVAELQFLYKSAPKDSFIYKKMKENDDFSIEGVGKVLIDLLGRSYVSVYKKRKIHPMEHQAGFRKRGRTGPDSEVAVCINRTSVTTQYEAIIEEVEERTQEWLKESWDIKSKVDDPLRELFQWAILVNYREIAMYIWEYMSQSLPAAIMATKILKANARKLCHGHEKKLVMLEDAKQYEKLAVGILNKCFANNPDKTAALLMHRLKKWGGYTCLHAATEANDKLFVSRSGVQYLFDIIWMSKLDNNTWTSAILLSGICPPLIWKAIKFKNVDDGAPKNGHYNDPEVQYCDPGRGPKSYNSWQKMIRFYEAPVVIFWMNVLAFLVYLCLFAFVILSAFQIDTVLVTTYEYVLLGWITTFLMEEIREVLDQEARLLREKIKLHICDAWNIMDLASLTCLYVGFVLRWFYEYLGTALKLYSIAFMIHFIRIIHIFAIHHILGPKIIMVGKMVKDLLFFLFILAVFLLAYGIASQALLYPGETDVGQIIVGIIYRPYWEIYGEIFFDEINYNPNVDGLSCSNATNSSLPRCPQQSTIVPIMTAVYLLLANVLLLNLLIAMFSNSFEHVERQSNEIWKFQRYYLIKYYYLRPALVPPFIFFTHIYRSYQFFKRKMSRNQENSDAFPYVLEMDLAELDGILWKWEHWHAEALIREKYAEDDDKVEKRLEKLGSRMENITSAMHDIRDRLKGMGSYSRRQSKVGPLSAELLSFTVKPFSELHLQKAEKKQEESTFKKHKAQRDETMHVKARASPYPNSNEGRVPVPDDKLMWDIEWSDYKPAIYTAPVLKTTPAWADKELESYTNKDRPSLPYNNYDRVNKVDRSSHLGRYVVVNGIPLNPRGRTGLAGRGLLGRYGPNHAADPVVTRWKRNQNKEIVKIDGKPVLEFVAVMRADTDEWAIPGGMVDPGEHVSTTLQREFSEEALNIDGVYDPIEIKKIKENVQRIFKSDGIELLKGYCDDHRNTDNAWIETTARNFHDEDGTAFMHIKLSPGEEANKVSWKQVDHNLKLFASHHEILKKTALVHNAYF